LGLLENLFLLSTVLICENSLSFIGAFFMNRRIFTSSLLFSIPFIPTVLFADEAPKKFSDIVSLAQKQGWASLPIGEVVVKVGTQLKGLPYVGGTLEGEPEVCKVSLSGLDCVTFFETSLCLARCIKKGKTAYNDFLQEVTFTRYRDGKLTDYTSRLHYTADWILNNEEKKVVQNITPSLKGNKPFPNFGVGFMSTNSKYYPALVSNPNLITVISKQEKAVNQRKHVIIPKNTIETIEAELQNGDIIAIATSKKGLDYAHTGMVYKDGATTRFFHASSTKKIVMIDARLSDYINSVSHYLGIAIARPLEV
jgi:hypothetical protein